MPNRLEGEKPSLADFLERVKRVPRKNSKSVYGFTPATLARIVAASEQGYAAKAAKRHAEYVRKGKLGARGLRRNRAAEIRRRRRRPSDWQLSPGDKRQKLALPGWQVICARMVEGEWYSRGDLRQLVPEFAKRTVDGLICNWLLPRGVVERAPNADHDPRPWPVDPHSEARWLYRLSASGVEKVGEWREVLGRSVLLQSAHEAPG